MLTQRGLFGAKVNINDGEKPIETTDTWKLGRRDIWLWPMPSSVRSDDSQTTGFSHGWKVKVIVLPHAFLTKPWSKIILKCPSALSYGLLLVSNHSNNNPSSKIIMKYWLNSAYFNNASTNANYTSYHTCIRSWPQLKLVAISNAKLTIVVSGKMVAFPHRERQIQTP